MNLLEKAKSIPPKSNLGLLDRARLIPPKQIQLPTTPFYSMEAPLPYGVEERTAPVRIPQVAKVPPDLSIRAAKPEEITPERKPTKEEWESVIDYRFSHNFKNLLETDPTLAKELAGQKMIFEDIPATVLASIPAGKATELIASVPKVASLLKTIPALRSGLSWGLTGAIKGGVIAPGDRNRIEAAFKDGVTFATTGLLFHSAGILIKPAFQKVTTIYKQPRSIEFTKQEVQDYFNKNLNTSRELNEAFPGLPDIMKNAAKSKKGVKIEMTAEQITKIMDRPWWATIKKWAGYNPINRTMRDFVQEVKQITEPAGLLERIKPTVAVKPEVAVAPVVTPKVKPIIEPVAIKPPEGIKPPEVAIKPQEVPITAVTERPGAVIKGQPGVTMEELEKTPLLAGYVLKRPEFHTQDIINRANEIKTTVEAVQFRPKEEMPVPIPDIVPDKEVTITNKVVDKIPTGTPISRQLDKLTVGKSVMLNPENVETLPEEMQIRDTPHAKELVESIINSGWSEALYNPIPVFIRDNKVYVGGDGHSRLYSWQELKRLGMPVPDALEFKVVSEAEAKKLRYANLKRVQLKPLEEMKAFKEMTSAGRGVVDIAKEYGLKETYVEDILSLSNLTDELKSYVRDKMLNVNMAVVIGRGVEKYGLPTETQGEIFHKWVKEQELTPNQLRVAIDNLAPVIKQQMDLGLVSMSKGFKGAINDVLSIIKEAEKTLNPYQKIISAVDKLKKLGKPIPNEIQTTYNIAKKEAEGYQQRINDLIKSIGREKPKFEGIQKPPEVREKVVGYEKDLLGDWQPVIVGKKPKTTESNQLSSWENLTRPKLEMPQKKAEIKEPTMTEADVQVEKPPTPDILQDGTVSTQLIEDGFLNATSMKIEKQEDVVDIFYHLKENAYEKAYILYLDKDKNVIGASLVGIGTTNKMDVNIQKAVSVGLKLKANSMIFAHNHPSGNVEASYEDSDVLKFLQLTANSMDMKVDYGIIINDKEYGYLPVGELSSIKFNYDEPKDRPLYVKVWDSKNKPAILKKAVNKDTAVDIIKNINLPDKRLINALYLDTQLQVRGVVPINDEIDVDFCYKAILKGLLDYDAAHVVLWTNADLNKNAGKLAKLDTGLKRRLNSEEEIVYQDMIIQGTKYPDNYISFSEIDKTLKYKEGETYVFEPEAKDVYALNSQINKLRRRIGIPDEKFEQLKMTILGTTDLTKADFERLLQFRKILNTYKVKVNVEAVKTDTKPTEQQTIKTTEAITEDMKSIEQTPERKSKLARAHILENKTGLDEKEIEIIKIQEAGWKSLAQVDNSAIDTYSSRLLDIVSRNNKLKIVKNKITNINMTDSQLNRFTRNYFGNKNLTDLTAEEVDTLIEYINKITVNYRGITKIPTVFRPLLVPEHLPLLYQYKVGMGKWIFEPYQFMRLHDIKAQTENLKELYRMAKEGEKPLSFLVEAQKKIMPMVGNDLRLFDRFGLYYSIGKPLEQAGIVYRKLENDYNAILERWNKVAKSKDGRECMWLAANQEMTPELELQLTLDQLAVVNEAKEMAVKFADIFNVKNPIKNYIHHRIEDAFLEYFESNEPFPEELLAVLEYAIPNELYAPFLKERKGFPFIKKDFIASWAAYFRYAARKQAYDDAMKQVNGHLRILKKRNPDLANYIKEFIQINILGRSTKPHQIIAGSLNELAKVFGEKTVEFPPEIVEKIKALDKGLPTEYQVQRVRITPSNLDKIITDMKFANYLSVVAMNTSTTLINLTQNAMFIARMPGSAIEKMYYLIKADTIAIEWLFKPKKWQEAKNKGILEEMTRFMESDKRANRMLQQFMGLSMLNMKTTEFLNRVAASKAGAMYKRALAKKGMLSVAELDKIIKADPKFLEECNYLDKETSDMINYLYGSDYTPPIYMSPAGRLVYHLNSYGLKFSGSIMMFWREAELGDLVKKWNKLIKDKGIPDSDEQIKFVNGLPPQSRKNFILAMMMFSAMGVLIAGDILYFTVKGMGISATPPFKFVEALMDADLDAAFKEFKNSFIPFKALARRLKRLPDEGISALWRRKRKKGASDDFGIGMEPAETETQITGGIE